MGISGLNLQHRKEVRVMMLEDYLAGCRDTPSFYANAPERMLTAIGEPEIIDTSKAKDPRLIKIFGNRTIKRFAAFKDFYGMEEAIEQIVAYFKHGAQGLEERKQLLYLLGPVGGGKSSMAERLKRLMEKCPIYVPAKRIKAGEKAITGPVFTVDGHDYEASPLFESPLALFDSERDGEVLEREYHIPQRRLVNAASPWALKRLDHDFDGDVTKFFVLELYPSQLRRIAVAKVEPGDENSQDVTTLIGKVDIRKLDRFPQSDPDAYSYDGGLNRTTQGLLEMVEMFKAPIKMLHPLLTAPQDRNYQGTDSIGMLPFQGVVIAHSNEEEWHTFRNNKHNEAFLDRIYIVKVPYCLTYSEEEKIYRKLIAESELVNAHCAPGTYEMLAQFCVLSRVKEPENSSLFSKIRVYNGDDTKDTDPKAKSVQEYRDAAGQDEGMNGVSTRFAYKVLSSVFNYDQSEVAANPVHLMYVLEQRIVREDLPAERTKKLLGFIKEELSPRYAEKLGKEIRAATLESFDEYGQNVFDRYIEWASAWIEEEDFRDPTGEIYNRERLNAELSKIEKPTGIANPKDFRQAVVHHVLRYRAANQGKNPRWNSYEKLREVIEKLVSSTMEDVVSVISFDTKKDSETEKKHLGFVERMKKNGYTENQIKLLVEWDKRARKS